MSYHHTIHRRASMHDQGGDIAVEEWLALIERDPSLSRWHEAVAGVVPPWAKWTAPDGSEAGFYWQDGVVWAARLSDEAIVKACGLAEALSARLQGDYEEFYRPDGTEIEC